MTATRQGAMICFDEAGGRFQLRAVGIAARDGYLLVHRATVEDFWSLPGGRVERNESAADTLAREMIEELQQSVDVGALLHVIENFFMLGSRRYHEIGLYHRMKLPKSFPFAMDQRVCHRIRDGESDLEFKWVPITREALSAIRLKPSPLIDALVAGSESLTHIVERDAEPLPMQKLPT